MHNHYKKLEKYMTDRKFHLKSDYANGTHGWKLTEGGSVIINYLDRNTGSGYLRKSLMDTLKAESQEKKALN